MRLKCRANEKGKKASKMKALMMTVVAALCCAALADGNDAGAPREGARRGGPGMRGGMFMGGDPILRVVTNAKFAEKLGLTDEQKAKLKEVAETAKSGRERMKKAREAAEREAELLKAEKIDEAAVMKTIDEQYDLRREMAKEQAKRVIAVKSILTPEQIAKLREETAKGDDASARKPRRGGQQGGRRPRAGGKAARPDAE